MFRTPDLRKKIFFVLGILVLYRFGATLPSPGVDFKVVQECLDPANQDSTQQQIYSLINMFSGGALLQLSVFAIGIMPYITASIIVQLLTVVIPRFEELRKEGQAGQAKMTQYALPHGRACAAAGHRHRGARCQRQPPQGQANCDAQNIIRDQSILGLSIIVIVMVAGAMVVAWFGELITERGIGNGMSLLISAGIVACIPAEGRMILNDRGAVAFSLVLVAGIIIVGGVVFIESGQRRIPVQYAKRMVGRKMYGGSSTYLPLKVNQAGVIPVIFASSLLYLPMLISNLTRGDGAPKGGRRLSTSTW